MGKLSKMLKLADVKLVVVLLLFLLAMASSFLTVIPANILGEVSNHLADLLNGSLDHIKVISLLAVYGGVLILGSFVRNLFCYLTSQLSNRIIFQIKNLCHQKFLKLSSEKISGMDFGGVVNNVLRNAERLELVFSTSLFTFVSDIMDLLIMSFFLFQISPVVLGIFVLVLPVTYFLAKKSGNDQRRIAYQKIDSETNLINHLSDAHNNFEVVRVFNGTDRERTGFDREAHIYQKLSNQADAKMSSFFVAEKAVRSVGTALALIYVTTLILQHELTVGSFLIVALYADKFFSPVTHMIRYFQQIQTGLASMDGILDFLAWPEFQPSAQSEIRKISPLLIKAEDLHLCINGAWVGSCELLEVPEQGLTILSGENGSGKTSLIRRLMGLIDSGHGHLFLDERLTDRHDVFSYAPQHANLFNISVLDNCLYPRQYADCSNGEVEAVRTYLRQLNFSQEQMDQVAGETGSKLSGGERKKISFIRAVMRDAPILILDEIMSNVDAPSKRVMEEIILEESDRRAVILISHGLADAVLERCGQNIILSRTEPGPLKPFWKDEISDG